MFKLKAPEGVTSVSIKGEAIRVVNGHIEVDHVDPFLTENGFEVVESFDDKKATPKKDVKKDFKKDPIKEDGEAE